MDPGIQRSGMQGRKLHERFMIELDLIHVQIDELWANVKSGGQDLWLWVVTDLKNQVCASAASGWATPV